MPGGDSVVLSPATASTPANQRQHHQHNGPPHYVDLHVNAGECVSLQMLDGQEQVVSGPATITMISQQQNPPVPIPVQVSMQQKTYLFPLSLRQWFHPIERQLNYVSFYTVMPLVFVIISDNH